MSPALSHQLEQAPSRMLVVLVNLQMLDECVDAVGQDGNLNLRRPRVTRVNVVFLDDGALFDFGQSHFFTPIFKIRPGHRWNTGAHARVNCYRKSISYADSREQVGVARVSWRSGALIASPT